MAKPQGKTELTSILVGLLRNFILGRQLSRDFEKVRELDKSVTIYTEGGDDYAGSKRTFRTFEMYISYAASQD